MQINTSQRRIAISGMIVLITAGNFFRLTGIEYIRPIHVVTLLTCGAAIGVFIMSVALFFKDKKDKLSK
jgi:hypothetical protein